MRVLPLAPKFSSGQLHQLHQQIQCLKLLTRGRSLDPTQITHIHRLSSLELQSFNNSINSLLVQAKSKQTSELAAFKYEQVPGDLAPKSSDFYCEMRATHLNELLLSTKDSDLKEKIYKELTMLSLRKPQSSIRSLIKEEWLMREEINRDKSHACLEAALLDRDFYTRKQLPQDLKIKQELKMSAKCEQAMRNGHEQKKKNKENQFLADLLNHHREFFDFHRKKHVISIQTMIKRNVVGGKSYLEMVDRQEQFKKDKNDKERLKALKENNIEIYIDLLNNTKNDRLLKILQQTDTFLRQLGGKVLIQKGESGDNPDSFVAEDQHNYNVAESLRTSSKMYYELTHTIREEIKLQPKSLEGGTLTSYQLIGLQWLVSLYNNNLHGILADEMGLGKTIQTIALFQYLIDNKNNFGPFLVVVPLSTLSNWMLELKKWGPKIKVLVYKGPPANRKKIITQALTSRKFNVLLTTYEYIMKDKQQLSKIHWSYIVVDEGHRMKNAKSKFAQILGLQYTSDHRLLLTGTPLQNNLAELWSLLNFLLPRIFHSLDDFEKWFNQPFNKMVGEKQISLNEEETLLVINRLHQVLRPFLLRRVKKEVESELPDKVECVLKVELSSWQKRLYKEIQEKSFSSRDIVTWKSKSLNNSVMQLRKVCNHPYLFLHYENLPEISDEIWRCSGKFELLDRMLPKFISRGHKILIFSQMTQLMDIMVFYFEYRGFKYLRLDGTTKVEERDKHMQQFNSENSEYYIFLLSTRAGGLGLNLQTADTVIIYDSDWNPMMDLQAQDRAHRIGQKKEVRVYRLVTNTLLEEAILTKAAYKKEVDAKVIQAGLFNTKSTDVERRERLRNLLKTEEDEEEINENEFLSDQQLNEIIARDDAEFEHYEAMDRERKKNEKNSSRLIEDEIPDWMIFKDPGVKPEDDEFGRGFRKRKFISYVDIEPEWNIDGSYKRVGQEINNSPKKYQKFSEFSEEDENGKDGVTYNTKNTSSEIDEIMDDIEDDAIYDPIND